MVRKIKTQKILTEEEKAALEREKQMEAAGIQDEFQAKGFEMVDWMQEHSKLVMGCIGFVVITGMVVAGVSYAGSQSNVDASTAFEAALEILDKPVADADASSDESSGEQYASETDKSKAAIAALEAMSKEHSGSNVSIIANMRAAQLAMDASDYAKALSLYQNLEGYVKKNDPLQPKVLMGLAFAQDGTKDQKSAAATFQRLVDLPGDLDEDTALWQSARLYKALKQTDAAKKNAERLISQYPSSTLKKDAESLLVSLGTTSAPAAKKAPTKEATP